MKKIMPWMAATMALAIGSVAHGEEGKVVHLDRLRILEAYQKGDPETAQFREEIEQRQREFEKEKAVIREMREAFDARKAMLSDEEREKQRVELTGKATQLITARGETQREMKAKEEFLTMAMIEKVQSVIQELGKENGYRYILDGDKQIVLFADDSLDITEAVMKKIAEDR
jgi:outer membrane protein